MSLPSMTLVRESMVSHKTPTHECFKCKHCGKEFEVKIRATMMNHKPVKAHLLQHNIKPTCEDPAAVTAAEKELKQRFKEGTLSDANLDVVKTFVWAKCGRFFMNSIEPVFEKHLGKGATAMYRKKTKKKATTGNDEKPPRVKKEAKKSPATKVKTTRNAKKR